MVLRNDEKPAQISDPSLVHRFLRVVRERGGHPMMEEWRAGAEGTQDLRSLSYREAFAGVCRLAGRFRAEIPGEESLVALVASPGIDFVLVDLALLMAGKTVTLIDHLQTENTVAEVLDTFGIRTLVTDVPSLGEALPGRGFRLLALAEKESESPGGPGFRDPFGTWPPESREWESALDDLFPEGRETVAHLLMTSGTTGRPKGVPLTHDNLMFDCDRILDRGVYEKSDRVLCVLPLHHSYPYMVNILLPLSAGATILFPPDLSPPSLRGVLSRGKVSLFPAVPAMWEAFHRRISEEMEKKPPVVRTLVRGSLLPFSLYLRRRWKINVGPRLFGPVHRIFGGSLKAMSSGGAALRPEIARDFFAMGLTMLEGYGLTETSPVACMNAMEDWRIGTVGRPLPGVEVKVDPPEGDRPGGRIYIRGKNVASSYWESPSKRVPLHDPEGWFETGDLGLWEEGFLKLVGREKEVIVLPNGKNIFAEPLERRICENAGILEAAVLLEKNALVALLRADPGISEEKGLKGLEERLSQAVSGINRTLPSHSRIASFEWTGEALPRTRLGKLRRYLLPDLFAAARRARQKPSPVLSPETSTHPVIVRVRAMIREVALEGSGPVEDEMNLESDLGIDSLGRIELLQQVEEILGKGVPEEMLDNVQTVGDLLSRVARILSGSGRELSDTLWERPLESEEEALLPDRAREERRDLSPGEKILYRGARGLGRILWGIRWPEYRERVSGTGGEWSLVRPGGEEVVIPSGPFLLVANHASYLDGLILGLCLPPPVLARTLFWGFAPLFEGPFRSFRNLFGIILIDPANPLTGLRIALHLLRRGHSLGIFPEGERSDDGVLKKFRPGVGTILAKVPVPVIPVGLAGTFEAYPPHRKYPRPAKIGLRMGAAIDPGRFAGRSEQEISDLLEREVRALLEPSPAARTKG